MPNTLARTLRRTTARGSRGKPTQSGGVQSLVQASDFTYLGSFRPPPGRSANASTGTIISSSGEQVVLPSSETGLVASGSKTIEVTSGAYAGQTWNMFRDDGAGGGGHRYALYPGSLPDLSGQTYRVYLEYGVYSGAQWGYGGLAGRRVDGQLRLTTSTGYDQNAGTEYTSLVYEFLPVADGSLSKDPDNLPVGEHVHCWDDTVAADGVYTVSSGNWTLNPDFSGDNNLRSLSWVDDTTLYLSYGGDYQVNARSPSVIKLVLASADSTAAFTRYGPYRMRTGANEVISYKRATGPVLPIPQTWADTHLSAGGSARLLVTGGGYFSLFGQEGGSGGPTATAIAVPSNTAYDPSGADDGTTQVPPMTGTPLLGYPISTTSACRRPLGVINRDYHSQYAGGDSGAGCRGATSTTLQLWMSNATVNEDKFNNARVIMTSGACAGQSRTITDFVCTGEPTATLDSAWTGGPPSSGDPYDLYHCTVSSASSTQVTFDVAPPDLGGLPYMKVTSGAGAGQDERTLSLVSGTTYNVSPAFTTTPSAGDRIRFYGVGYSDVEEPTETYAYWVWGDMVGGAAWINTTNRKGLLFPCTVGMRHQFYDRSSLRGRGLGEYWLVMDPDDLADVAAGSIDPEDVIPTYWEAQYTDEGGDPQTGYLRQPSPSAEPAAGQLGGASYITPRGCWFDPVDKRLYVLCAEYPSTWNVHVYQMADT